MPIRRLQSKVVPKSTLAAPPIETDEIDEDPDKNGLPAGEEWVSPPTFSSVTADAGAPDDGISKEPIQEEDLNDFLLSFFTLFKEPTDKQIHLLAEAIGMSFDELERAVYKLTSAVIQNDDEIETQDL